MLEQYFDLLESFQKYQLSAVIERMSSRFFAALKHPNFNLQATPYFIKQNATGIPFTEFTLDPDNVSQIKKILNALYLLHKVCKDIEALDFKTNLTTIRTHLNQLWNTTVNDAYEGFYLLTHLDVDIQAIFHDELSILTNFFTLFKDTIDQTNDSNDTSHSLNINKILPLSYTVGEISGTALIQMKPQTGSYDYGFLTQFSALLPGYINQVKVLFDQYSNTLIDLEPAFNDDKVRNLKKTALNLLNDLEHLNNNGLFISLKFLNYIYIIRNIITLSLSIIEELRHVSESSQDVIRDKLAQLKYHYIAQLFGLVDKIEINCLVTPGTLSKPLMKEIKGLYEWLIFYAAKPVDFQLKGEELLKIEDSRFIALRLDARYKSIDEANLALFELKKAEESYAQFYDLLAENEQLSLSNLPKETKNRLCQHYKIIKPLMFQASTKLDSIIMLGLLGTQDWSGYFSNQLLRSYQYVRQQQPTDHITTILQQSEQLRTFIEKKKATHLFYIQLNKYLIDSLQNTTDIILFPYREEISVINIQQLEELKIVSFPQEPLQTFNTDEIIALRVTNKELAPELSFKKQANNITLTNPEYLSVDQTFILQQWYSEKYNYLQSAQKAFTGFVTLLEQLGTEYAHIQPHTLHFNRLKKEEREQLHSLYQQFHHFFINGIPDEFTITADRLARYFNDKPHQDALSLDAPLLSTVEPFVHYFQELFKKTATEWCGKIEFYKKQAKYQFIHQQRNVFLDDEANALYLAKEDTKKLLFTQGKTAKSVANPEQLSAKQALILYQWYTNKRNKFDTASKAYQQFYQLLKEEEAQYTAAANTPMNLSYLDADKKLECRRLYNLFQPYFIHGVPANKKETALLFDNYLVHSFAEKDSSCLMPCVGLLDELDEHFQVYFTQIDKVWHTQQKAYLALAQKNYFKEQEGIPLAYDKSQDRAHYLIKHKNYSSAIKELRMYLKDTIPLFNNAMQVELNKYTYIVPYQELQNALQELQQCKQVLPIKQLHNCFFHLENIIKQLEKLNDQSTKIDYLSNLLTAYREFTHLNELMHKLGADPHLCIITASLMTKTQSLWAMILESLSAYQVGAAEVKPREEIVAFSGVWYTLSVLNIVPKHIRSLRNKTCLAPADMDELHINAKKASLTIERLIHSSHSYVQLFLQAPSMILLYDELTSRLCEFINTIHDAATINLNQFHTYVFSPMLAEADSWEDKLGLAPGTFSKPLQKIITEYYKGLLHPLQLRSSLHIQFFCDKTPLQSRKNYTQHHAEQERSALEENDKTYANLIIFHDTLKLYNQSIYSFYRESSECKQDAARYKTSLIESYPALHPQLIKLQRLLKYSPRQRLGEPEQQLDNALNRALKDYHEPLRDLNQLIPLCHAYYCGIKNSHAMSIQIAIEKLAYLNKLETLQEAEHHQFILDMAEEYFKQQYKELTEKHIGLQYVDEEYANHLKSTVHQYKEIIIEQCINAKDIKEAIHHQLKHKISQFEQTHFADYYQLDKIQVALAQFKNYFSSATSAIEKKSCIVEDAATLKTKSDFIGTLTAIANNSKIPNLSAPKTPNTISERIEKIREEVMHPRFTRIMLQQKNTSPFSLTYWAQCVLSLLEALNLYTPQHVACLNNLKNTVQDKEKIATLYTRFGLFKSTSALHSDQTADINEEWDNDFIYERQ